MPIAYIGLGSNLENPFAQLIQAIEAIDDLPLTAVMARSSCYQNPPVGYLEQPDFVNAVLEVRTRLSPEALLQALLKIEISFGRERNIPNGPRILDLDLLLYDNLELQSDSLSLPHPQMKFRTFVLWPLYELNPNVVFPDGTALAPLALGCNTSHMNLIHQ